MSQTDDTTAAEKDDRAPREPDGSTPRQPVLACELHPAPPPMDRRSFLVGLAGVSLGAGALFAGATVIQAVMPPSRSIDGKTKVGKLPVASLADLQTGKPVLVEYGDDVVFVTKTGPNSVNVLNAACPHVGCKLSFNQATKQFDCPCHASHFDINGKKLGGPAPRDMVSADFQIVGGQVVVASFKA